MSKFYTAVALQGNNILCKEIVDGKSRIRKVPYKPSFYTRTKDTNSPYRTMEGYPLARKPFNTIKEARDFVSNYDNVENHEFFGNTNYIYQFICDEYQGVLEVDMSKLGIWTIDIENEVSDGFTHPAEAKEPILLITMLNNQTKQYITWGRKKFSTEEALKYKDEFDITKINLEYRYFKEESDLLSDFLFWWKNTQIDCLTGWNTEGYDTIYLYNRIMRVLGSDTALQLSPFRIIKDRLVSIGSKEYTAYDYLGIAHLDYLPTYKKFTYITRESYKLDHIGDVELGVKKLDMGCTFRESYQDRNWIRFVLYNLRDCEIVDKLEDKLGLIQLIYTMAYDAKCLPNDLYSPVKTWDCMMYRFMLEKNIIVPQKKKVKSWSIEGAYVKEPKPGQYNWIASFDAASLYPTIIMQYNMSPETLVDIAMRQVTVDGLLRKEYDLSDLKELQYGMTANGQYFRNDINGLFPEIVSRQFNDRKMYKKQMQKAEAAMELLKAEMHKRGSQEHYSNFTEEQLNQEYVKLTKEISKFNNFQMAKKIFLNSLFGAAGNEGFRFYDPRLAEGITMTGQYFIRTVGAAIDAYIAKITKVQAESTFYQDTDSCYVALQQIVEKYIIPQIQDSNGVYDVQKVIDAMDKIANEKITPTINAACDDIARYTNSIAQLMNFKREALADRGVWCAKKKYALNVYDNEGIRYSEPKIKIMGLEVVRSSTPAPVRKMLKEAVKIVLTGTENELQSHISGWRDEFFSLKPEDIAFPRGVQGLEQYTDVDSIYRKGCPMHVRSALLFNYYIEKNGLKNAYPLISNGEKIKFLYLKVPNTVRENVFGFIDKFPRELGIDKYVDYDTMWEKAFINPLDSIISTINWTHKEMASLDGLFE